ncbi:MAG: glycosyltransferase [Eubacteriales bacterium]|nr:glycosyltransferase [Eubacteriales bacterium]
MEQKKVSVIIAAYNQEKYIAKCIRSLQKQTYADLEILVINDGSSDRTGEILHRMADKDPRMVIFDQENSGVSIARNRGVDASTGNYLTFVDGDDYVEETYIEELVRTAQENRADMVVCGLTKVTEDGQVLECIVPGEYKKFEHEEWIFRISAVCAHLYKRELWEKHAIRFCPGVRGEDMPISLFFSGVCENIKTLKKAGYYYVQHEGSAMHQFSGLRTYRLPYEALENAIVQAKKSGIVNSPEFFELFVLRICATCFFQLAAGASPEKLREAAQFIVRIITGYFPEYYKNKKTRLCSSLEIPFAQKAAVKLLILLIRTRLIYPAARVMSRKEK